MKDAGKLFWLCFFLFFGASCGGGGGARYNRELSEMIERRWQAYTATLPESAGGLALYAITPRGEFFASTQIEGAGEDLHFRAASNTKTFTAAAIMLLHQEGRLNIDDLVTSSIPGRDEPYVPDTPGYHIPYKNQITIFYVVIFQCFAATKKH